MWQVNTKCLLLFAPKTVFFQIKYKITLFTKHDVAKTIVQISPKYFKKLLLTHNPTRKCKNLKKSFFLIWFDFLSQVTRYISLRSCCDVIQIPIKDPNLLIYINSWAEEQPSEYFKSREQEQNIADQSPTTKPINNLIISHNWQVHKKGITCSVNHWDVCFCIAFQVVLNNIQCR